MPFETLWMMSRISNMNGQPAGQGKLGLNTELYITFLLKDKVEKNGDQEVSQCSQSTFLSK